MNRSLKVTVKVKEHGSDKVEIREMLMVITIEDDLEELVQMAYGSWYHIVEYTYEPINIHVSERYCHQVSALFLERGC
jgi:hypothetical protein